MANKKFFVDIDLYKNQLLNVVLQSGDTSTLLSILDIAGQIGFNTTNNQIEYYDGTNVQYLLAGSIDFSGNTTNDAKSASIKAIYDYYKSTTNGEGASSIGIEDSEGHFDATDVEGALIEIGQSLDKIGSSMEVVGIIDATGGTVDRDYPTTGDATKTGYTSIEAGDSFLVVGNPIGDFSGDTGTYVQIGPSNLWVSSGSLIVARVSGATNSDDDWFILDSRRGFSSETASGLISLATQSEVDAGTDDTKAVTPLKLRAFVENISGSTMYVETVNSGQTSSTITHNLGDDVNVQVWLDGTEDITSGIQLTSGSGTVSYESNVSIPGTLKFVCIGKTTAYWT